MSFSYMKVAEQKCSAFEVIPGIYDVLDSIYNGVDRMLRAMNVSTGASLLQGCLPLLMHEMPADKLIERVGQEKYRQLRACYKEMSLLNLWYSAELRQVLEALISANIPVLVLKGSDVATTLYPRPDLRYFDDVDLMVQPHDRAAAAAILEQLGYSYHQEYRFEAISKQRAGFVYVKAVAAGYLMFELHTSPHSNELNVSFDVSGIWKRARPIIIADIQVYGMGLEDLFLYQCWHFRSHSFDRLIWLYDAAMILLQCGDQLDWTLLYQLACKQGLRTSMYFVMCWCQQLFHVVTPKQVEQYTPRPIVQWLIRCFVGNDTTEVFRRTAKRERKILQYLMVDDLKALCLVGLHVLFPSPTHLGRLYMEHSRLPLHLFWLYYFVHPILAIREAVKVA